jgi:hypothetical protein
MMSQRRQLREYQLIKLMLEKRAELYAEFLRVMQHDARPRGYLTAISFGRFARGSIPRSAFQQSTTPRWIASTRSAFGGSP